MMHALAFPLIDSDRMNPSSGGGGLSVRAWLAVAFVVWVAVWAFLRLNDYFVG
jgi:hypothetical protein